MSAKDVIVFALCFADAVVVILSFEAKTGLRFAKLVWASLFLFGASVVWRIG